MPDDTPNPTPPAAPASQSTQAKVASTAVGLATLKSDAQAWATALIDELASKVEGGLPQTQAALDKWIAGL